MTLRETIKQANIYTPIFDNCPKEDEESYKQCEFGCSYLMTSYADAERHYLFLGHGGKPTLSKRKIKKKVTNKVVV